MSRSRGRPWFWAVGKRRPLSPRPLIPWRILKPEPLANPLLGKWLCVLKDARPCRIFQCRYLSKLVGPTAIGDPCRYCRPLGRIVLPESHSRPCAFVLPTFASGSLLAPPLEDYGVHAGACKSDSKLPPAEPFATGICAARHREWLFG